MNFSVERKREKEKKMKKEKKKEKKMTWWWKKSNEKENELREKVRVGHDFHIFPSLRSLFLMMDLYPGLKVTSCPGTILFCF